MVLYTIQYFKRANQREVRETKHHLYDLIRSLLICIDLVIVLLKLWSKEITQNGEGL